MALVLQSWKLCGHQHTHHKCQTVWSAEDWHYMEQKETVIWKMNSECLQHLCGKINFECLQHLCRKTTTFNACSTYVEKYKLRELTALSCPGLITPFVCRYGATQVYVVLVSFTYKILTTTYSVHKSCKRDFRSFKNTTSFVASHVGGPSQLVWLYIFNIALSHDYAAHSKYLSEQDFQLND